MQKPKKFLSLFLAVLMIISVMPFSVNAVDIIDQGSYGNNITWTIDDEGKLIVSGTGEMPMPDYTEYDTVAWYSYRSIIKNVVIEQGITNIGSCAFSSCTNLESITIPDSVTVIGHSAFHNCSSLKAIKIPDGVERIEPYTFYGFGSLTSIIVPAGVTYIGSYAFWGTDNLPFELIILNKDCHIDSAEYTISRNAVICGYQGSTAHKYALSFVQARTFVKLDGEGSDIILSGSCGDNAQFTLTRNGTLSITGSGPINMREGYVAPWNSYNAIIKIINIADGISILGNNSFKNCVNVSEVVIPESVTSIDNYAFTNCVSLKEITITNPECSIYDSADTISDSATIYGYPNSTAQEYAEKYNRTFVALTCQHSNSTFVSSVEATCTEKGYTTYFCAVCNNTYDADYVDAYGHCYNAVVTPPTCTANGYTTYTCECGDSYVADEVVAEGHKYVEEVTTPATHMKEGVKTFTCSVCSDSYTETIEKIAAHSYNAVVTPPTCTVDGYTTYTCECGDSYVDDEVVAEGHKYVAEVTTLATHMKEGVKTFTCSVCSDSYTETIEKIEDHSYNAVVTPPTCTANGYTTYTCECGDSYVADEVVAEGHKYVEEVTT
ncbi:MAG: leucine-rich repeat domain-containing protein, partial [Clostridia bacterium]|nr:leucine-rich repeat domain-containing protein [Clostridia bacterium]